MTVCCILWNILIGWKNREIKNWHVYTEFYGLFNGAYCQFITVDKNIVL